MGAPDLRSRLMMVEGSLRRKRNLMLSGTLLRDQVPLWYVLKGSILSPRAAKLNDQSQPQWEMMSRRGLLASGNKRQGGIGGQSTVLTLIEAQRRGTEEIERLTMLVAQRDAEIAILMVLCFWFEWMFCFSPYFKPETQNHTGGKYKQKHQHSKSYNKRVGKQQ
ncbi:hypothetical protein HAX54_002913 [Datura stramonium]|uniref:Uncharacterized protein n=1 Tax=Datura stramonium TaxID=4076 RepID=A0ABS8T4J8_DATST|nr:hypothetical protein [Datura stramonium]